MGKRDHIILSGVTGASVAAIYAAVTGDGSVWSIIPLSAAGGVLVAVVALAMEGRDG